MVYITAPLPYLLLLFLFIRGLPLEGAFKGMSFLFEADFLELFSVTSWRMAGN